jgi:phosphoglycolate phosphatase
MSQSIDSKKYQLIIFDWFGTLGNNKTIFPGVLEMLSQLQGAQFLLAIASSMPNRTLSRLLEINLINHFFCHIQTDDLGYSKPEPEMLHMILMATDVPATATLMVGDSMADIAMAKAAQIDSIAVTPAQQSELNAYGDMPLAFIKVITELPALLKV